jgi:hypothetical protein
LASSLPLPVHGAAYGGNSLLGRSDTHRVDAGLVTRMSAIESGGKSKLEVVERKMNEV